MQVKSNHSTLRVEHGNPCGGKPQKNIFINVYSNQPMVTKLVGTNLLETPISLAKLQLNKILCRHQPTGDTNSLDVHQLNKTCIVTNLIYSYK